jgi:polar amino acid transport system substrate-binding protein
MVFMSCSWVLGKTQVTIYGDDSYPPYSYVEKGKLKGIYTQILKKAFSRMGTYEITIKGIPWKRGILMLKNGVVFALYPPYFWPIKRPYMDYSKPILAEKLVIFINGDVLKERKLENWPHDFIGLKIGKNAGFEIFRDIYSLDLVKSGQIIIQEAGDNRMNILKLASGRIDAYINDRFSILWELKHLRKTGEFQERYKHFKIIEGPTLSTEYGYLGFTNTPHHGYPFKADFKDLFNQEIEQMKKNGEIEKIVLKFYGE